MPLVKTPLGQLAFSRRSADMSSRQRMAFILFDGKRSTSEVLKATAALGLTMEDFDYLVRCGMLERVGSNSQPATLHTEASPLTVTQEPSRTSIADANPEATVPQALSPAPDPSDDPTLAAAAPSEQDKYQAAYLIATQLTAGLGLRGLRLNLAVEAAGSYAQLLELAPKIQAAVGEAKFAPLAKALGLPV